MSISNIRSKQTSGCGCFSIRDHLAKQGVTCESVMRKHIAFILETERATGMRLRLDRYRVNPECQNSSNLMMA